MNNHKKRILLNIKSFPYFYKICEACDKIVPKDSPFCLHCGNYRFEDSIVKVTNKAEELLTIEDDPLDLDLWEN